MKNKVFKKFKILFNTFLALLIFCFTFSVFNFQSKNEVAYAEEISSSSKYADSEILKYIDGAISDGAGTFDFFHTSAVTPESNIIYGEWLILYEVGFNPLPNGGKIGSFTCFSYNMSDNYSTNSAPKFSMFSYKSSLSDNTYIGIDSPTTSGNVNYFYDVSYYSTPSVITSSLDDFDYDSFLGSMFYFPKNYEFNNFHPLLDGKGKASISGNYYIDGVSYPLYTYFGYDNTSQLTFSDVSRYLTFKFVSFSDVVNYAFSNGYEQGRNEGFDEGAELGYTNGFNTGFKDGYNTGSQESLEQYKNELLYFPFYDSTFDVNYSYVDWEADRDSVIETHNFTNIDSNKYLDPNGFFKLNSYFNTITPYFSKQKLLGNVRFTINLSEDTKFVLNQFSRFTYRFDVLPNSIIPNIYLIGSDNKAYSSTYLGDGIWQNDIVYDSNYFYAKSIVIEFVNMYVLQEDIINGEWSNFVSAYLVSSADYNMSLFDIYYKMGKDEGYDDGYKYGNFIGYNDGKRDGFKKGQESHTGLFYELFSSVTAVPVNVVMDLFSFEVFGYDMRGFITSLFSIMIVLTVFHFFIK